MCLPVKVTRCYDKWIVMNVFTDEDFRSRIEALLGRYSSAFLAKRSDPESMIIGT